MNKLIIFILAFLQSTLTFSCEVAQQEKDQGYSQFFEAIPITSDNEEGSCSRIKVSLKPNSNDAQFELSSVFISLKHTDSDKIQAQFSPSISEISKGSRTFTFCISQEFLANSEILYDLRYKDVVKEQSDGTITVSSYGCIVQKKVKISQLVKRSQ